MREIKFRAWDIEMKRYVYPELWDNKMPTNWKQFFILEQFTGLYDKNGKEIYEGDIVNHGDNFPSVVKYDEKECAFRLFEDKPKYARGYRFYPRDHEINAYTSPIEIIGNIHENPELVKA